MSDSEEAIYSIMFSSLKHPVRRKILRMLSHNSMSFSKMLDSLGISSSHLTYHLENLGELVSKTSTGNYQLSTFGLASVNTMKIVEDAPSVNSKHRISFRFKSVIAVLLIVTIVLASFSALQYVSLTELSSENEVLATQYNELNTKYVRLLDFSADTDKAIEFIQDVVKIDLSAYQVTLLSNDVTIRSDLGGVVEEFLIYSLTNNEDRIDVTLRFRDSLFSRYQINVFEGSVTYSEPQPFDLVESASNLLNRYMEYGNASYLGNMSSLLGLVDEVKNIEITDTGGNLKLKISTSEDRTEFFWLYTKNDVDFSAKSLSFVFKNRVCQSITDGWVLFESGSTEVNISRDEAIDLAKEAALVFTWEYEGEVVGNFTVLDTPVVAVFHPHPREDFLNLIPYWYVTLYLDKVYPGEISSIAVGLWGDTGEINDINVVEPV